jgi:hypothetical protein
MFVPLSPSNLLEDTFRDFAAGTIHLPPGWELVQEFKALWQFLAVPGRH